MILIAEMIYAILLHPACIGVFLAFLVIIPIFGDIAILDGFIFISGVSLLWNRYNEQFVLSWQKNRFEAENRPTAEKVFRSVLPGSVVVGKVRWS